MSECGEELYRIATALEKIAKQGEKNEEEPTQAASIHGFYAIEVEAILDTMSNDFELRRALRNLVKRAKEIASQ